MRKERRRKKERRKEKKGGRRKGGRKKERGRKKGRKERANYTRKILRFDKVQISYGVKEPCLTHSVHCISYEEN